MELGDSGSGAAVVEVARLLDIQHLFSDRVKR